MRVQFPNIARPKSAAKLLSAASADLTLSRAQNALANVTGYRDWHDLTRCAGVPAPAQALDPGDHLDLILKLATSLDLDPGQAQYALSRSRVFGPDARSLDAMLGLRAMIWRAHLFGEPGRGKPGTLVRVKGKPRNDIGYLVSLGEPSHILYDTGYGMVADFEVITPRAAPADFVPSRLWLPYGFREFSDGSTIVFSRDYCPMWKISSGAVDRLDPWDDMHRHERESHFATIAGTIGWSHGKARDLALAFLAQHRLFDPPRLLDAMPFLFVSGVQSVGGAVDLLRRQQLEKT